MKRLLVVHHTPSPKVDTLVESLLDGARNPEIDGVEVVARAALAANATDVMDADGYLLATPANLGYMSGALKHFFDLIYYPCLRETTGRPYGMFVHGNDDVDGAIRGIERIVKGLAWKLVAEPVRCVGDPASDDVDAVWELGAVAAATLMEG